MMDIPSLKSQKSTLEQQLVDARGRFDAKSREQFELSAKGVTALSGESLDTFRQNNAELSALQDIKSGLNAQLTNIDQQLEQAEAGMKTANGLKAAEQNPRGYRGPTLGSALVDSPEYKAIGGNFTKVPQGGVGITANGYSHFGAKMLATNDISTSNAPVYPMQVPTIVPYALWPATFSQYLPRFSATSGSINYFRQTGRTSGVAATAEKSALTQSDFTTTKIIDTAHVVGTFYKITEQELADAPYIRQFLDFTAMLEEDIAIEDQLLTGSGSGENLTGFYNVGSIGSYVRGTNPDSNGDAETNVDAIARGIRDCRITGVCDPSLVVVHTSNMTAIRLLKNQLGDYIWGNPADNQDLRIWGVPILETPRAQLNTALTGDFVRFSALIDFPSMPLTMRFERVGTDSLNLEWTLLIYMRLALQVRRLAAFETISNLSA